MYRYVVIYLLTTTDGYPATTNKYPQCNKVVNTAAAKIVGLDRSAQPQKTMGAEDFAFFLEEKPGRYCCLSVRLSVCLSVSLSVCLCGSFFVVLCVSLVYLFVYALFYIAEPDLLRLHRLFVFEFIEYFVVLATEKLFSIHQYVVCCIGCFFFVGAALPGEVRGHHKSVFDFDEVRWVLLYSMFFCCCVVCCTWFCGFTMVLYYAVQYLIYNPHLLCLFSVRVFFCALSYLTSSIHPFSISPSTPPSVAALWPIRYHLTGLPSACNVGECFYVRANHSR
jgi:hypothetical protein